MRGPLRMIRLGTFTDFSGMFVASRRWTPGVDPYQSGEFNKGLAITSPTTFTSSTKF